MMYKIKLLALPYRYTHIKFSKQNRPIKNKGRYKHGICYLLKELVCIC